MKKSYVPLTLALALAVTGSVAFAEELAISATSSIKAKTVNSTSTETGVISTLKKKLDVGAKKRVQNTLKKIDKKFSNALDRLIKIDVKIETRINKFADMGIDMAETKTLLNNARENLLIAQNKFTQLPQILTTELAEEEVSKDTIKTSIKEVKESLIKAHSAYVQVVVSLKAKDGLKPNNTGTSTKATTTATSTLKLKTATSTNN